MILEFNAGIAVLNATTKQVTPDPRKGKICIFKGDDELLHFCWKPRNVGAFNITTNTNSSYEEDLILFPGDAEFIKAKQSPDGNVFYLKFHTSDLKKFFWLQENDISADEISRKVSNAINSFGLPSEMQVDEAAPLTETKVESSNEKRKLKGMSLSQLQEMISNVKTPQTTSLSSIFTMDKMKSLFDNPAFLNRFYAHFPSEAPHTKYEMESIFRSSQFQQAISSLDEALQNGELGPFLAQFGLDSNAAFGGVDSIFKALKKKREQK